MLTFRLWVSALDNTVLSRKPLYCQSDSQCKIYFKRAYTPIFYYLQPPVVYYQSITSVIFDPKSTESLNINLPSESKPFTNTKIGGFQIDFSGYVDETTRFSAYYFPNAIMG
jgi:hypothetical protein